MNPGTTTSGCSYPQAFVDQRPVYDNAIRKGRRKKRKKRERKR